MSILSGIDVSLQIILQDSDYGQYYDISGEYQQEKFWT